MKYIKAITISILFCSGFIFAGEPEAYKKAREFECLVANKAWNNCLKNAKQGGSSDITIAAERIGNDTRYTGMVQCVNSWLAQQDRNRFDIKFTAAHVLNDKGETAFLKTRVDIIDKSFRV